jgi:hypothetical protein
MHYTLEACIVGIYSSLLYLLFRHLGISNIQQLLCVVGFFKHLFGSYLGVHTYYCNFGYACLETTTQYKTKLTNDNNLLLYSFIESILYLFVGNIFLYIFQRRLKIVYLFFIIGFSLHIISEFVNIHKYYCQTVCSK